MCVCMCLCVGTFAYETDTEKRKHTENLKINVFSHTCLVDSLPYIICKETRNFQREFAQEFSASAHVRQSFVDGSRRTKQFHLK